MGLIHNAKKAGLWPPEGEFRRKPERIIDGGLVIESAEGVRFAYTDIALPEAILPIVEHIELQTEPRLSSETDPPQT
jgi:hypothetical protein